MSSSYQNNYPTSGYASESVLRDEFERLEQALADTISRTNAGSGSNAMSADLDMALNDIINVSNLSVSKVSLAGEDLGETLDDLQELADKVEAAVAEVSLYAGSRTGIFPTVSDLKQYSDATVGTLVQTKGYYSIGDGGHADYIIVSDSGVTVDGFINHRITGTSLVAVPTGGEIYIEQAGIINEGVDYLDNFTALFQTEKKIRARFGGKEFDLRDVISTTDKSIDADLGGNTLVSTGDNERVMFFQNTFSDIHEITTITSGVGRVTFTLSDEFDLTPFVKGAAIKVFSDDVINPATAKTRERQGEYFIVESVNGNNVKCIGSTVFEHVTNPRCAVMNTDATIRLCNFKILRKLDHVVGEYSVGIDIIGYYGGHFEDIKSDYFSGQLLSIRSCYRCNMYNIEAKELLDDTLTNAVGYVGFDFGTQESRWHNLVGGKVRHVYTTGAADIDANHSEPANYGGAVRCQVFSGIGHGCTNYAWDTHEDAVECEFHNVVAYDAQTTTYSSSGGYQDRGIRNKINNFTYYSNGSDISASGKAVLFTTGSTDCYIKNLYVRGVSGRLIESYRTSLYRNSSARIDNLVYTHTKQLNNLVILQEAFDLTIGKLDIYPIDQSRTFYGAGVLFKLEGGCRVRVKEMNLYYDDDAMPNLAGSSAVVFRIDGEVESVAADINIYCTSNTFHLVDKSMRFLRSDDFHLLRRGVLNIRTYCEDYDGTTPQVPRVQNLDPASSVRYTYKLYNNGVPVLDTAFRKDNVFEPDSFIGFGPDEFFINECQALNNEPKLIVHLESQANTVTISEIQAPSFEGQELEVFVTRNNTAGNANRVVFEYDATNLRMPLVGSNVFIQPGGSCKFIAWDRNGVLAWEAYNDRAYDDTKTLTPSIQQLPSGVVTTVTLEENWRNFNDIVIVSKADQFTLEGELFTTVLPTNPTILGSSDTTTGTLKNRLTMPTTHLDFQMSLNGLSMYFKPTDAACVCKVYGRGRINHNETF